MVDPSGDLWVTDYSDGAVTEYAAGAQGNVAPIATITGKKTNLATPDRDGHGQERPAVCRECRLGFDRRVRGRR